MSTIVLRALTKAQWTAKNARILKNELVLESDTGKMKIGNGIDRYSTLDYYDNESTKKSFIGLIQQSGTTKPSVTKLIKDTWSNGNSAVTDPDFRRVINERLTVGHYSLGVAYNNDIWGGYFVGIKIHNGAVRIVGSATTTVNGITYQKIQYQTLDAAGALSDGMLSSTIVEVEMYKNGFSFDYYLNSSLEF